MAQKRGSKKVPAPTSSRGGSKRKNKQPTQKPDQKRIAVMGPTGKIRMVWVPWEN